MASRWFEGSDEGWKRAITGGISGATGFLITKSVVGGDGLEIAVGTGVATLVLVLVSNAVVFNG